MATTTCATGSMEELGVLLAKATPEERRSLAEILKAQSPDPEHIMEAFWWNCQSIFGYIAGSEPSYSRIVYQVAEKLKIEHFGVELEELEVRIARKVLRTVWDKMTPEQRAEFDAELRRAAQQFEKGGALAGSASAFAALTAAQLSGFGVYILASTALSALSGTIGVTLPFVAYTTMSSVIATIIGPVGWIGAGLFAVWGITGANYKRLISAILYISMLRAKEQGEFS